MGRSPQTNLTAHANARADRTDNNGTEGQRRTRDARAVLSEGLFEMSRKIARYLAEHTVETPCLVVDLDIIAQNYKRLNKALPDARIYYAVKANPAAPVLGVLRELGSNFDTASIYEIEHCLAHGIGAERISFG